MGTNDPQGEPQTTDTGALDIDRTGSPDQGTPEHAEAMRELEERQRALAEQGEAPGGEPVATEPPAPPAETTEG